MKRHYAETYHGKLVPLEEAQKLVTVSENIELRDLEKIIPFSMCRDIVLENPDAILACKCVCRMTSPNHCRPDEVCLVIGEPYVSYILDHQPEFCRRAPHGARGGEQHDPAVMQGAPARGYNVRVH